MTDNGNNFDQESLLKSENMTLTEHLRMGQRRKFFYRCINNNSTYNYTSFGQWSHLLQLTKEKRRKFLKTIDKRNISFNQTEIHVDKVTFQNKNEIRT